MKNLKNLFLIGLGSLVIGGCGNSKEEIKQYNQENKQVYSDFADFIKENNKKYQTTKGENIFYLSRENYSSWFHEFPKKILVNYKNKTFYDEEVDGINGMNDYRITKAAGNIEAEFSSNISPEKQLEIAKDYTENLKQILYGKKYKNY